MNNQYIPPPFPFPQAWPQIFQQDQRWLHPHPNLPFYCLPITTSTNHIIQQSTDISNELETNTESEYEYTFELTNDWKDHFQQSYQSKSLRSNISTTSIKKVNKKSFNKKSKHLISKERMKLNEEIHYATYLEQKRKGGNMKYSDEDQIEIQSLEIEFTKEFKAFYTQRNPIMWPYTALQ